MLVQSNSESSRQDEFQGEPAERTYLVREQRRDLQNSLISSFMNYSVKTYNYLIDYVLPQRCLSCSEILNSSGEFCGDCWQKLEFIAKPYCNICGQRFSVKILDNVVCGSCYSKKPSYNLARSLFKFNEYSKKVVHQFKYQDKTIFAKTFAKLLCNRYLEDIKDVDLIIAVPMNRFKRLLRMYNPPQILAEEVAKIMNITVKADILIKSKWTKAQTFLSKRQRKNNISGSIKFNTKYNILGKKILLIDDVITTGVTINECSKILRAAGAKEVKVVSVAMT